MTWDRRRYMKDEPLEPRWVAKGNNYIRQERAGREVMAAIEAYAIQLGCAVNGDEIICTTGVQSELLTRKYKELTGAK